MSSAPGNQSPNTKWTCMSQSPGIRKYPRPFTLGAFRGYFADLLGPTDAIRFRSRMTVWSTSSAPLRTSTTDTLLITTRSFGDGLCASDTATRRNSDAISKTPRIQFSSLMARHSIFSWGEVHNRDSLLYADAATSWMEL